MQKGFSGETSVGRFGRFKENAGNRTVALNTCVVNDCTLFTFGKKAKVIGEPAVGREVRTRIARNNWCGRTIELTTRGETQRVDLYTTLPGPLFTPAGRRWGFDWAVGSSFVDIESLPDGGKLHAWGVIRRLPQVMLLHHPESPCLLLTSERALSLEIITHEHWWFSFRKKGVRIMIVPLLDIGDAPRTAKLARLWLDLLERPPVACAERFEYKDGKMTILAEVKTAAGRPAKACPIPPMAALLGNCSLQQLPRGSVRLLAGYAGPYAVLPGKSAFCRTVQMDWLAARLEFIRPIKGKLSPLPRELAYAGDMSWNEKYPMDALLSMRVWAPLAGLIPPGMWNEIKRRIKMPTGKSFKKTLARYREPSCGQVWAKDRTLFKAWGEVSYDTDWYTGLTLSGMWLAAQCSDRQIAGAAKRLYTACRGERRELTGYCRVFSDWAFEGAFTDPRGEGYDYDCSHNAIEGILAEARMRASEGDIRGRDFCYYIAARFAVCFLAAYPLAELHRKYGLLFNPPGEMPADWKDVYGLRVCRERWGAWIATARTKSWAPLFPEYCALLKRHGPLSLLRRLAREWEAKHPERYADWLKFYVGGEVAESIRSGGEDPSGNQEWREQAAVFYHVNHDVMLRLLVLGEDPRRVEGLYKLPLPPAEQALCRAGARLADG